MNQQVAAVTGTAKTSSYKLFATCPSCGRRLCKAIPGSEVETDCPKCLKTVLINVENDGKVTTQIIEKPSN